MLSPFFLWTYDHFTTKHHRYYVAFKSASLILAGAFCPSPAHTEMQGVPLYPLLPAPALSAWQPGCRALQQLQSQGFDHWLNYLFFWSWKSQASPKHCHNTNEEEEEDWESCTEDPIEITKSKVRQLSPYMKLKGLLIFGVIPKPRAMQSPWWAAVHRAVLQESGN